MIYLNYRRINFRIVKYYFRKINHKLFILNIYLAVLFIFWYKKSQNKDNEITNKRNIEDCISSIYIIYDIIIVLLLLFIYLWHTK